MLYRIGIEPLWGEARWQIISECLLAFSVTVAFHLRGCMSPQRPNQSNIRDLPRSSCSSTMPFILSTRFLAVSDAFVLTTTVPNSRHKRQSDQLPRCLPAQYQLSHQRGTTSTLSKCFLVSLCHCLSQHFLSPLQWRLNMNTHMNIWINKQVVIVIHLHALCRTCKVFCLQPVLLLSMGFLTECLKWGRGEWEHRCSWVALLLRENDLCLQMPPLSVFRASFYAPVPCFFCSYHAGIQTCHLPRWQTAGVPAHIRGLVMSVKCCPPECVLDASFDHLTN